MTKIEGMLISLALHSAQIDIYLSLILLIESSFPNLLYEFTQFTLHVYYKWISQRTSIPRQVAVDVCHLCLAVSCLGQIFLELRQDVGGGLWQQPCQLDLLKKSHHHQ